MWETVAVFVTIFVAVNALMYLPDLIEALIARIHTSKRERNAANFAHQEENSESNVE
ncbi:hypothetical protein SAMN05421630_11576 [Prauserella marina]|uniref:Uncharacterized protein n=1 Tax=Prauserella marina TaxID=530584 RepID=A0A1G6Z1Y0_9PSEU|nr:hypothetical protein [Prauserella marina]PWV71320.1 hypothetical protein DES30_11236 [Prauserella marina]SDD96618.1 hypothetical protein SAMN05421630_11576 [Prauserella marina]